MNLLNPFRTELSKTPYLNDLIDSLCAKINAIWSVEHKGDGTHGDVTADSATIAGDLEVDGFVSTLDFGDADESNAVGQVSIGPETRFDYSDYPTVGSAADVTTRLLAITKDVAPLVDGTRDLGYFGTTLRRFRAAYLSKLVMAPVVYASTAFYERSRNTALGEWIAVAFNAANFTASSGTWTLAAGDQLTFKYTLVGKTMTVNFRLDTTTVSATPTALRITIPGSFTVASDAYASSLIYNDNGVGYAGGGAIFVVAGGTMINLQKVFGTSSWAAATDTTAVNGQLTFEVA